MNVKQIVLRHSHVDSNSDTYPGMTGLLCRIQLPQLQHNLTCWLSMSATCFVTITSLQRCCNVCFVNAEGGSCPRGLSSYGGLCHAKLLSSYELHLFDIYCIHLDNILYLVVIVIFGMHLYRCLMPLVANSLQSGRF